jgi:hypothetical protein
MAGSNAVDWHNDAGKDLFFEDLPQDMGLARVAMGECEKRKE